MRRSFARVRGDVRRHAPRATPASAPRPRPPVCVVIMLGMMRFATDERPDSLAAIMNVLATPLECESGNDLTDASGCRARWAERFQRANECGGAGRGLHARRGRDARGPLAEPGSCCAPAGQRRDRARSQLIEELLDVGVARAARAGASRRLPVAGEHGAGWSTHATVRATKQPALDVPLPPKKRAEPSPRIAPSALTSIANAGTRSATPRSTVRSSRAICARSSCERAVYRRRGRVDLRRSRRCSSRRSPAASARARRARRRSPARSARRANRRCRRPGTRRASAGRPARTRRAGSASDRP